MDVRDLALVPFTAIFGAVLTAYVSAGIDKLRLLLDARDMQCVKTFTSTCGESFTHLAIPTERLV